MQTYNSISIQDSVILLTGAFGQIGREISISFLRQGAKVIMADINLKVAEEWKQKALQFEIKEEQYFIHSVDITNEDSCSILIESALNHFGKIDVLINNAAIDAKFDTDNSRKINMSRFELYPMESLRQSVEINLLGTVLITQLVCRQMLVQKSGNIINVASTYSVVAPNQSLYDFGDGEINYKPIDYVASKSFILNFTRYIATFYARDGIRCNAIVPHGIFNNHPESFLRNWEKLSPLGRMCNSEELNGPFTFLASNASSYMTGAILNIDGGWTAW